VTATLLANDALFWSDVGALPVRTESIDPTPKRPDIGSAFDLLLLLLL
jgi:hypothetical protein